MTAVNWADTARPFMHTLVHDLNEAVTADDLKEHLQKLGKTPTDFLIDSLLNVLGAVTNNNWALGIFQDKLRANAVAKAQELCDLFGGEEAAILGIIKQDLTNLEGVLHP